MIVILSAIVFVIAISTLLLFIFRARSHTSSKTTEPRAGARPDTPRTATLPEDQLERQPEDQPEGGLDTKDTKGSSQVLLDDVPPSEVRMGTRLGKSKGLFAGFVTSLRSRGKIEQSSFDELEEALIRADVGVATTDWILDNLRARVKSKEISGPDQLIATLRLDLIDLLECRISQDVQIDQGDRSSRRKDPSRKSPTDNPSTPDSPDGVQTPDGVQSPETLSQGPRLASMDRSLRFDDEEEVTNVWLFVGVNGVGKTTTVGKVARQQVAAGRSVLLAAGDTFRAAAGEQLSMWSQRSGAEIVRGAEGADPSSIIFDAVQRAGARGNNLVLGDTAGRLHTKVNLIEELKKIRRVADRPPGRVTEVLLVLDATTGQNGLVQARQFTEAIGVTGLVLTKLDGTAKGGIVVAVQRELGLPVKLVGLGEGPDDLIAFDPSEFVDALLG